jgi:hypothetical protein
MEPTLDKTAILCDQDKTLLHAFSKRALERVIGRSFASAHLPFVTEYMEANVAKEVEKDRIIITHAAKAFSEGWRPGDLDRDAIFESTKAVDKTFVKNLLIPSLTVAVKYEDIADIRKKRIASLSQAVYDVVTVWDDSSSFETVVQKAYSKQRFREVLAEILHLYNLETKMLSSSIHFLPPFNRAMNFFAESVFDSMTTASEELVSDCAVRIYGD